jgi:RNA polymerase sigma factor (sigma-70 family)
MLSPDDRSLGALTTSWILLHAAHDPAAAAPARSEARQELLCRYLDVARRYLGGALRGQAQHAEVLDELLSDFGLRVMDGALHGASPDRGRFRDYLRRVLANLVNDYHRKRGKQPGPLGEADPPAAAEGSPNDEEFTDLWREELVRRSLRALVEHERRTGEVRYTVLKLAMDQPELEAADLARQLAQRLGRPVEAAWVRKRLFLARQKLRELLRQEVRLTLREPTDEAVEEELAEVGLLAYCR